MSKVSGKVGYFGSDLQTYNYHTIRSIPSDLRKIFDRKNELLDELRCFLFYECEEETDLDIFEELVRLTIENMR